MKIKILIASFGVEVGQIYPATLLEDGYLIKNGHFEKVIKLGEAEIYDGL